MGDLNAIMRMDKRIGMPIRSRELIDMRQCMEKCGLEDIKATGNFFTWTNKQEVEGRVFCKLDRALGNEDWGKTWDMVEA